MLASGAEAAQHPGYAGESERGAYELRGRRVVTLGVEARQSKQAARIGHRSPDCQHARDGGSRVRHRVDHLGDESEVTGISAWLSVKKATTRTRSVAVRQPFSANLLFAALTIN